MSNDIDERMAALLKDHQQMGARSDDKDGEAHTSSYPLEEKNPEPKKAAKKK